MAERTWEIVGPADLLMSKKAVCLLFDFSESTLDRLIDEGRFPHPGKASVGGAPTWGGEIISCWLKVFPFLWIEEEGPKKPAREKTSPP